MNCTCVMTVHDEGLIIKPTLDSIAAAGQYLKERGGDWELIVIAVNADEMTTQIANNFSKTEALSCTIIETSFGEPGPARNAGVAAARHDWVAIHDADELVCENWLHAALMALQESPKCIAHSHWSLLFGQESMFWGHPQANRVEWRDFEISNPWSVQCVAAKAAFLEVPYRSYSNDETFEFEDWFWNAEVERVGYQHIRIADTVHAVRRKPVSRDRLAQANRKILQSIWSSEVPRRQVPVFSVDDIARSPPRAPARSASP